MPIISGVSLRTFQSLNLKGWYLIRQNWRKRLWCSYVVTCLKSSFHNLSKTTNSITSQPNLVFIFSWHPARKLWHLFFGTKDNRLGSMWHNSSSCLWFSGNHLTIGEIAWSISSWKFLDSRENSPTSESHPLFLIKYTTI